MILSVNEINKDIIYHFFVVLSSKKSIKEGGV